MKGSLIATFKKNDWEKDDDQDVYTGTWQKTTSFFGTLVVVVVLVVAMMMMMIVQHLKESGRHFGTGSSSNCSKDTGTTLEYLREGPASGMFVDALLLFIIFRIFSHEFQKNEAPRL